MSSSSTRKTPRPTTPLRRIERGSLSALSQSRNSTSGEPDNAPLESLDLAFAELSDSFSDFYANMQQVVELDESVSRFNEAFASFLYGMNVNAFCVDFPEAPIPESFRRAAERKARAWQPEYKDALGKNNGQDATFMTTDDSFVERPPPRESLSSGMPSSSSVRRGGSTARGRGGVSTTRGRGGRIGAGTR